MEENSMIAMVKEVSKRSFNEELAITIHEYDALINELYNIDKYLQYKYKHPSCVPRIYSLYGVKISIV